MSAVVGVVTGTWLGLVVLGGTALAAHPFGAEDAGTVGAGVAEVELATAVDGARSDVGCVGVSMVLHVGLSDAFDLGASLGLDSAPRPDGSWGSSMIAPVVDGKLRLTEPTGPAPGLAAKLSWRPAVDGQAPSGHEVQGLLAATWEVDASELELNAGATGGDDDTTFQVAVGASTRLNDLVHVGVDTVLSLAPGEPAGLEMMAGALFHVTPSRVVSVGVGAGWGGGEATWVATAGLTAAFGGGQ
ncbi:MAG: hypothetical protein EP329_04585 [Deltaproteobacteria bacterium]|nr:MAG: hypothetical protein EP329_04585 [Deltaproteobacteria bacterium]